MAFAVPIFSEGFDININLDHDGGDCYGSNVNTDWCTECLCLEGGEGQDTISQQQDLKDEKEQGNINVGCILSLAL